MGRKKKGQRSITGICTLDEPYNVRRRAAKVQMVVINLFNLFFVKQIFENIDNFFPKFKTFSSLSWSNLSISNLALLFHWTFLQDIYLCQEEQHCCRYQIFEWLYVYYLLLLRLFIANCSFLVKLLSLL